MASRALLFGISAATLALAGCGGERVSTYSVPKERDPEPGMAAGAGARAEPDAGTPVAGGSVPTAGGADLAWEAPPEWKAQPASAMRKASYRVPGDGGESELSVTAFPGDVGGELANVNRWRGQVGLAPLGAGGLDSAVSRVEANGLRFTIVELYAKDERGKSIVGAIVPYAGSTWFFKLTGPGALVRASEPAFTGFLRTVRAP